MNTGPANTDLIVVQTVIQLGGRETLPDAVTDAVTAADPASAGYAAGPTGLLRQQHRVPVGTSIRALLCRAGQAQAVLRIESGTLGLACHGRRAWLDDVLENGSRVEVVEPINVDAKAARAERVAAARARRRTGSGAAG